MDFSGKHFKKELILVAVRWCVAYPLSHRQVEEMLKERGVEVDHATEPRVIKRANILNCLHLGYTSTKISQILNVNQKTVTNIAHVYLEDGLES